MARLIAERANVLLLDEPTNHLALDILEAFEQSLLDFPGPILAVSHDRWFIDRFSAAGGQVWELYAGCLIPHAGETGHVIAAMIDGAAQPSVAGGHRGDSSQVL